MLKNKTKQKSSHCVFGLFKQNWSCKESGMFSNEHGQLGQVLDHFGEH